MSNELQLPETHTPKSLPPNEKQAEVLDSAEIAIVKRRQKLTELLQHGDPFTGRFLANFREIVFITKRIIEEGRLRRPSLKEGINGSRILFMGAPWNADLRIPEELRDKLKEHMAYWNINYGAWKDTYTFESFDEMVKEIVEVILHTPNMRIDAERVKLIPRTLS